MAIVDALKCSLGMQDFASDLVKKMSQLRNRNGTVSSVDRRRPRRGGQKETRKKRKVCFVRFVTAVVALFGATYRVVDSIRRYLGRRAKEEEVAPMEMT